MNLIFILLHFFPVPENLHQLRWARRTHFVRSEGAIQFIVDWEQNYSWDPEATLAEGLWQSIWLQCPEPGGQYWGQQLGTVAWVIST